MKILFKRGNQSEFEDEDIIIQRRIEYPIGVPGAYHREPELQDEDMIGQLRSFVAEKFLG